MNEELQILRVFLFMHIIDCRLFTMKTYLVLVILILDLQHSYLLLCVHADGVGINPQQSAGMTMLYHLFLKLSTVFKESSYFPIQMVVYRYTFLPKKLCKAKIKQCHPNIWDCVILVNFNDVLEMLMLRLLDSHVLELQLLVPIEGLYL